MHCTLIVLWYIIFYIYADYKALEKVYDEGIYQIL